MVSTEPLTRPQLQTMRAAVLRDVGRMEIAAVPRPRLQPHEVLVRVTAVGLCGTDHHIYAGHANYHRDPHGRLVPLSESPQILGHEIAGTVVEVGGLVRDLAPGDAVAVDQGRSCVGEHRSPPCEYCRSGDSHQCEHYREHGITGLPGGFAEYIAVPAANAVRVEAELDPAQAAMTEPLGCVVHSAAMLARASARYSLRAEDPERRVRAVLICGAGPAGLLFVQYLRNVLQYQGVVLVSEPNRVRRELAARFGAEAIDPTSVHLASAIRDRTDGRRVELLIEASGSGAVFTTIPELLRKQATVLLYGHGHSGVDLGVLNGVQFLEPTLVSPVGASGGFDADGRPTTYRRALRLIESREVDVASLISHRYTSLDAVPHAFAGGHRAPDYVKGVVTL